MAAHGTHRDRLAGESPPRRAALHFVLFCLLTIVCPSSAAAHDPPPVDIEATLDASSLKTSILIREEFFRHWFPDLDPLLLNDESEEFDAALDSFASFLAAEATVVVDRVPVQPVVEWAEYQEGFAENDFLNYVALDVVHGVKGEPRQIAFSWQRFDTEDPEWDLEKINGVLIIEETKDYFVMEFVSEEPQVIWHAPRQTASARKPWTPTPPETIAVPWVTVGLLASLLLTVPMVWRRRRAIAWGVPLATALLAAGLHDVGVVEVVPPWTRADLPDEEEARYIFESLHRNIYRAFDYEKESEIYDALARSVDGELLDSIYNEVYQGLVIEEEGGAVCKVKGVKVLESDVLFPDATQEPRFEVRCRWRVTGVVEHWGHSHWRTNEYRALYRLVGDGQTWRIHDAQVEGQERITNDSGEPGL